MLHRAARALARHRRSDRARAGAAHPRAVGGVLVRHRHAGPRHLFPRALRHTGVADRRLFGRDPGLARGLFIGLVSGFVRRADGIVMRVMDGLMSIPPILLAIALMALTRGSVGNVITRHHHRGDSAGVAPGAQRRAVAARAALCGRRGRGRHPHADDHPAPHPARTRSRR